MSFTSWGPTLRLPKSTFPARFFLGESEKLKLYNRRCTDELYAWQREVGRGPAFVLHDGPPYANGTLHIGHALNKILKDITCRYQVLKGRRVHFRPGWDCHGLPIELKALQSRPSTTPSKPLQVRAHARKLARDAIEDQKHDFRKWAIMADWSRAWTTMDKEYELRQLEIFKDMVKNGQIYRRLKPVYWSPSTMTALAEAELEYNADHTSVAAFVKFPMVTLPKRLKKQLEHTEDAVNAVIWTTTPWTIPANKAIAVHKQLEYVVVRSPMHGTLLVAKTRLSEFGKIVNEDLGDRVLGTCLGSELVGTEYRHPLLSKQAPPQPVFHADFVSADSGTGLVHVAPGHGMDDYKLCQEYGIEPFAPVDDQGRFTTEVLPDEPQLLGGLSVLDPGSHAVLELLRGRGYLINEQAYKHKYPYDWRSKTPVIIRSTRQWFADLSDIRESALQSLHSVRFVPDGGHDRLSSFVRGRSEWCISRQRAWGVPIPALYDKDTGEAIMTAESISHIISVMMERGTGAWWVDDETDQSWVLPALRDDGVFLRGKETMDVWFDSGTSWQEIGSELGGQASPTADVYLEGTDQHRGWFQSSLLTKIASQIGSRVPAPVAPFKTLVTHGFTLDSKGKKMSKSEGNVVSPNDIIEGKLAPPVRNLRDKKLTHRGFGPDALRLWVASSDCSHDIQVGKLVAKSVNINMTKLRVTFKLLLGLLDTHQPQQRASFDSLRATDQMALIRLRNLSSAVHDAYSKFEYHRAAAAILSYINTDFSSFYFQTVKDRLYASAAKSPSRINAQLVVWEIFKNLLHLLYPITPLLIEEALDHLPAQHRGFHPVKTMHGSNVIEQYRAITGPWLDPVLEADMPYLSALSDTVNTTQEIGRKKKQLGSSLQCFVAIRLPDAPTAPGAIDPFREVLLRRVRDLEDILVVSRVELYTHTPTDSKPDTTAPAPCAASNILPNPPLALEDAPWKYSAAHSYTSPDGQLRRTAIDVYAPAADKCMRCWKYNVPTDANLEESMCTRCLGVVEGAYNWEIWEGKLRMRAVAKKCRRGEVEGWEEMREHWDFGET
ncbi:MAG: hypothetical protein LQ340_005653 [Diploschistes diacapsis]|nr:MAG: hypothetical protein LQ340_005653 [Diploschistes diacapsis]